MRVISLSSEWENRFWKHVNQDPLDYYFFIFDWKLKRAQSRILLAVDEANDIAGFMLIYCEQMVQVRGTSKAVKLLLSVLDVNTVELSVPVECKDIVLSRFPSPSILEVMMLMYLERGQENIKISTVPQVLSLDDADAIVNLMQQAYPTHWSDFTSEFLQSMFKETIWLGIKDNQKFASIGVATLTDVGSHIMFIATDAQYRNCGYATSIVSALTQRILEKTQTATIHVIKNNIPAIRTYSKVGFKPYKSYLYVKT